MKCTFFAFLGCDAKPARAFTTLQAAHVWSRVQDREVNIIAYNGVTSWHVVTYV